MKKGPRSPAAARTDSPGDTIPEKSGAAHPEPNRLVDLAEGRLSPAIARSVRSHLRTCAPCDAAAKAFAQLVETLAAERADRPPPALSEWARALPDTVPLRSVDAPARASSRVAGAARRGMAAARAGVLRLVADSWGLVSALGQGAAGGGALVPALSMRSGEARASSLGRRRLLFSARPFDLDIEVDYIGEADPRRLHGQILPVDGPRADWQGSEVRLTAGGRTISRARVDRRGEFRLARIQPGRYRLEIGRPVRETGGGGSRTGKSGSDRCTSPLIEV